MQGALNEWKEAKPMSQSKKIVAVARGELATREDDGKNKDKAGRIATYWEAAKHSQIDIWLSRIPGVDHRDEWCAAFASWVYREAGLEMSHRYGSGFPGCGEMIRYLEKNDAWYDYRDAAPVPGDLVFFDWQRLPSQLKDGIKITSRRARDVVDHVGIVEEVVEGDEGDLVAISTIEGNWNAGVSRATRRLERRRILGFGCLLDPRTTP